MARLVPSVVKALSALPWGGALGVHEFQRVVLRLILVGGLGTLLLTPAVAAHMAALYFMTSGTSEVMAWATLGIVMLCGLAFVGVLAWVSLMYLKVSIMRWRGLGLYGAGLFATVALVVVSYVVTMGATELSMRPELLLMGLVPYWVFKLLYLVVFIEILQALFTYWLYLEETPLSTPQQALHAAYATPAGPIESILLLVLQFWIWLSILGMPASLILSIYLN